MTANDRDVTQKTTRMESGTARQRKTRRDRKSGAVSQGTALPSRKRSQSLRAVRNIGPSVREKLASTHVTIPVSVESIQGKVLSNVGRVTRQMGLGKTSQKSNVQATTDVQSSRRKSGNRRIESHYQATPHSETQRKFSSARPFIPKKSRRVYDAHSGATPPVMVRGGMGGMAFGRVASSRVKKQKAPRRRFDVPLKVQGAEVRLPSIPLVHIGWRAVSLLLVLMTAASLFLIWKAPAFQVTALEAQGLQRLTVGDLNAVMGTFGSSVFTINPDVLEETLYQAFPELLEIKVKVGLPASIKVDVTERIPVIAWVQDGSEVWLDAQGISFPPRGAPEAPLVRVEGHGTPPGAVTPAESGNPESIPPGTPSATITKPTLKLESRLVGAILSLGAKIPADTMLVYDSDHGLGWNDPNGWEVYFGREDQDMEMKLNVYQTLVDHLQSEGIQPEMISVEYVHAPYYRMER